MPNSKRNFSIFSSLVLFLLFFPFNRGEIIGHASHPIRNLASSTDLIEAVNALRISNGLPAYQINPILMNIAQAHSDYQASIGTVTHYGADGSRPFQRALAAGYPVAGDLSLGGFFSENIAAGTNFSSSDAVASWQLDAPHLNTMLSSTLRDIGAGVSVVGSYVYYTIDVGLSTGGQISTPIGGYPTYDYSDFQPINKILTTTPQVDGSIIHIVKTGETIWSISIAYKVLEGDIYRLNSLKGDLIFVGEKLIIRPPFTPTPTIPTLTPTTPATITLSSTPTILETKTPLIQSQTTSEAPQDQKKIILAIIVLSLLLSGLLTLFWKKKTL